MRRPCWIVLTSHPTLRAEQANVEAIRKTEAVVFAKVSNAIGIGIQLIDRISFGHEENAVVTDSEVGD